MLNFLGKRLEDITGMDLRYYYGIMREKRGIGMSTMQTRLHYLSSVLSGSYLVKLRRIFFWECCFTNVGVAVATLRLVEQCYQENRQGGLPEYKPDSTLGKIAITYTTKNMRWTSANTMRMFFVVFLLYSDKAFVKNRQLISYRLNLTFAVSILLTDSSIRSSEISPLRTAL